MLFVSHAYRYKMLAETIQAFRLFKAQHTGDFRLVVAGSFPDHAYERRIVELIHTCELTQEVDLLGSQDQGQLKELYSRCQFFVFPSICENAGSYALIDAMSMGKPVLCSRLSSMPEICGEAVNYFDPRDENEMAEGMLELARSPALRAKLASASRNRAESLPSWDQAAQQLVEWINAEFYPA